MQLAPRTILADSVHSLRRHRQALQSRALYLENSTYHTVGLIRFRRSNMGAALSHSLRHSRCLPLITLERKHLRVSTRLLLLMAAYRPGCSAFRRPAQAQQCAGLMSMCGPKLQESSKCMLASMHACPSFQHPFCTGVCHKNPSPSTFPGCLLSFEACVLACRDSLGQQ